MEAQTFKEIRQDLGLKKKELADTLGKSIRQIEYYESGKTPVPFLVAQWIADMQYKKNNP